MSVSDEKFLPYTFGYLALFLAAVSLGCGILVGSAPMLALGAVTALGGPVYLMVARKARSAKQD